MPGREEEVGLWRILPGFLREGLLGKALPKFRHCQKGGGGGHIHDKICWWICSSNYKIEHFPLSFMHFVVNDNGPEMYLQSFLIHQLKKLLEGRGLTQF